MRAREQRECAITTAPGKPPFKSTDRDGPRRRVSPPPDVDLGALKHDLEREVDGEVRFDAGTRALYANDFSIYRHVPLGAVAPRDADDVIAAVAACRRHGAPILPRGAGTGPSGQTVNVAVVFDYSKLMNEIVELDPTRRRARVRPGAICDEVRHAAEAYGLTYGPDPATHEYCTFGGMIGNNSCGTHSLMAGKTNDNVEELEVLLYDGTRLRVGATSDEELERIVAAGGRRGEIYGGLRGLRDRYADLVRERFPDIPRRVSGYNLDELLPERGFHVARALVGTEGTCVNVLEATVRLVPSPPHRVTVVLGYSNVFEAADHVPEILTHEPLGLEGFNDLLVENMAFKGRLAVERERLPPGGAWLLAEWGGDTLAEARERAEAAVAALDRAANGLHASIELLESTADEKMVWTVRESAVGDSRAPGALEAEGNWEDAAVHPDKLGAYLRDFQALLDEHELRCVYYGHFGQGCVHTRMDFDLKTAAGVRTFRSFMERAADLVVSYGGSLAGEYGEGQGRSELLPRMFGPELMDAFREFKAIWDPDGKMNPDRLIDAPPLDQDLRIGPDHRPPDLSTEFAYPRDRGSFATAVERCFGMGKCRRTLGDGYTMCPSYQVTGEERHSTRGRARLLFEMLKGEQIDDGWRSEEVREALDLCLSCKGCRADCPTQVDLATLKAEFLSHHYRRRLRPRAAYSLGLFPWWARLAVRAPRAVNAVSHAPLLSDGLKQLGGISPERELPRFAPETFRAWFERRGPRNRGGRRVVLWPDTFTDHLAPHVARAAVEVLEGEGMAVELPPAGLCCGRPLYDFGMLALARRTLRQVLDAMGEQIHAGVPVVGLEPSCVAVFRDELVEMLPGDEDAHRLSAQTHTLAELLTREVEGFAPPPLERRALVQAHCHHRAIMGLDAERSILDALGLELERVEEACCGMAGSFGYEAEKHDVSVRIGERAILPAVRAADPSTLILADGYSCRSQIADGTGRRALHLAEVLRMAGQRNGAARGDPPER